MADRVQALHLEVFVLQRFVHRSGVEAAAPLARRLLLHREKGQIGTFSALGARDQLQSTDLVVF